MQSSLLKKEEEKPWIRRSVVGIVALLLLVGIVGAVVVNKNQKMDVSALNPDASIADAVEPLAVKQDEPATEFEHDEVVAEPDEEVPEPEGEEEAHDTLQNANEKGDYEEEFQDFDDNDKDGVAAFKASKGFEGKFAVDADSGRRRCYRRRVCRRVKAGDRNNDDRDDFKMHCYYVRRCRRCRRMCRRQCRRRCYMRRYRACRWHYYRRCYRRRRRVRGSSSGDRNDYRYYTHCRRMRRRICRWRRRRVCRPICRTRCRYVCRRGASS